MQRAYSVLTVKAVDEEERVIEGVASTPSTDRMDDIVEPMGAKFKLPMPLLWQHRHDQPIGHVEFAEPSEDGIPFRARIAKIADAGILRDEVDKAWQAIKAGLVRGVSIGFRALEDPEPIKGTFGFRFKSWEWLELSAVTIPANAEATITAIKSIDAELRAASGQKTEPPADTAPSPGASGTLKSVKINRKPKEGTVNYAERIRELEATRQAKAAEREQIQEKVSNEGRTKDESERESFDTLGQEIKAIDAELKDLREMEKENARQAKTVEAKSTEAATASRDPRPAIQVKAPHAEPGIRFARVVKARWHAQRNYRDAGAVAKQMYPDDIMVQKAAVGAGTTDAGNWAGALVGDEGSVFADFVEFLRPQTILGRFGNEGVPGLRQVPFYTPLVSQTGGGDGYWVGEGAAKPLTALDFSRTTLEPLKVANIAVLTEEVLRNSSPSAERIVRDEIANALRARLDTDFIDPDKAAAAGVSPASVTNGVTIIQSAGTTADDVRTDIRAIYQTFIDANNAPKNGVWIMPSSTALALSLIYNLNGQPEFPGIGMNGGMLHGLPVITSEYVPDDYVVQASPLVQGALVVLANASDIYLGDEGGVAVDASREASLEMDNAPTGSSATPTGASLVSMFQTNSVAFRAERTINWAKRRAGAVAVLGGVNWA